MKGKDWAEFQKEYYAKGRGFGETRRSLQEDRFQFARQQLWPAPAKVLDVGCNDGSFTLELLALGYDAYGIDFWEAIEKIQADHPDLRLRFDHANVETDLAFSVREWKPFDCILLLEILEHVIFDFQLLETTRKSLRKGGKVIISVPLKDHNCIPGDHHLRYYTPNSLWKILWVTGFAEFAMKEGEHSLLATAVRK